VTCLNKKHMLWAWMSLFWVGFTDLYIRLCSLGILATTRGFFNRNIFYRGHSLRNP